MEMNDKRFVEEFGRNHEI